MTTNNKCYISEFFYSIQGEGIHSGCPSVFLRLFGCNLDCKGFGQCFPTKPETYETEEVDGSKYKSIKEIKVPKFGCDTPYSKDKSFLHLCKKLTAKETASKIVELISSSVISTDCRFKTEVSDIHLVITGGEPMLHQEFISELILELEPAELHNITIETNGTVPLKECLLQATVDKKLFMSISPKLFNCSGIPNDIAIKPDVINDYAYHIRNGQLKFVVSKDIVVWDEIRTVINKLNPEFRYPIVVMPVGSTVKQIQSNSKFVAETAMKYGYRFSPRLHVNLWGNKTGT